MSGTCVLREHALLADGERGALIDPRGEIAWMGFPRRHSDAIFSTMIGGEGRYSVTAAHMRGMSEHALHTAPPSSTRRNTTSSSDCCEGTSHKRSCTRSAWNAG
jgi:hypothetical protein